MGISPLSGTFCKDMAKNDNRPDFFIRPGFITQEVADQLNETINYLLERLDNISSGPSRMFSFGGGLHQESDQDRQINNARRARLTVGQDSIGYYSWQEQYSSTFGLQGWSPLEGCGEGHNYNDTYTCTQPTWEANSLNPTPAKIVQLRRAYTDPNIGSWTYVFDRIYQLGASDGTVTDRDVVKLTFSGATLTLGTSSLGTAGDDTFTIGGALPVKITAATTGPSQFVTRLNTITTPGSGYVVGDSITLTGPFGANFTRPFVGRVAAISGGSGVSSITTAQQGVYQAPLLTTGSATQTTTTGGGAGFAATLTYGGIWNYNWKEQSLTITGAYTDKAGGLSGNDTFGPFMNEVNNTLIRANFFEQAHVRGTVSGQPLYEFQKNGPAGFNGSIQFYDALTQDMGGTDSTRRSTSGRISPSLTWSQSGETLGIKVVGADGNSAFSVTTGDGTDFVVGADATIGNVNMTAGIGSWSAAIFNSNWDTSGNDTLGNRFLNCSVCLHNEFVSNPLITNTVVSCWDGSGTSTFEVHIGDLDNGYAINVQMASIFIQGTTGNTIEWGTNIGAPSVKAGALPASAYTNAGSVTHVLGDPSDWILVNVNGVDRKIPVY